MRQFFQLIITHTVFTALCAVAMVLQTTQLLHLPVNYFVVAFVFFSTMTGYNFHWLVGSLGRFGQVNFSWLFSHRINLLMLFAGSAGIIWAFPKSNISLVVAGLAFLLTFIYSIPLLPIKQLEFTRKAGFLKTILLAFTWTFVTAYIPIHEAAGGFESSEIWWMTRRFLFMLMLCIIFDNRDIAADKIKGLHSLATDLKPSVMKWLIYFIFLLLFLTNFHYWSNGFSFLQFFALQLSTFGTLIVYLYSRKRQSYFFYYFLVDGMMLISAILTTVASI